MARKPVVTVNGLADQMNAEARAAREAEAKRLAEARDAVEKEPGRVTVYVHPKIALRVREVALKKKTTASAIWVAALLPYLEELGGGTYEEIVHGEDE